MVSSLYSVILPLQAQVLHWKCFKKLEHIYGTQLWSVIEPTLDAIVAGIKVHLYYIEH